MAINPSAARDAHLSQGLSWWVALGENSKKMYGDAKKSRDAQYNSSLAPIVEEQSEKIFDIYTWIKENWQLAIIGFVALLVLLRD